MSTKQGRDGFRITGVSHIALFAHDVEKSLAFYEGFLGLQEQFRLTEPDGSLSLAFVKINDRQCIELFPEREAGTDRLHQVAFIVENIEALRAHLEAKGFEVPPQVKKGRIGNSNFSVKDPDGHIVELVQYEPDGWTARDAGRHMGGRRISSYLRHVGFTVRSLDAALAFYRDVLGCSETWRGSAAGSETLSWVNMKVPDGDDYVELMLYRDPPSRERLGVMNHMSLEVSDVPAAAGALVARAAASGYDRPIEPRTGINRKRQLNLFDPDGTRAELMERETVDGAPAASSTAPAP